MNIEQKDREHEAVKKHQKELLNAFVWRSCFNCVNFMPKQTHCMMHNATPPAEVVLHGCRDWEVDIPF